MKKNSLFLILMFFSKVIFADIFQCADGEFRDTPCPKNNGIKIQQSNNSPLKENKTNTSSNIPEDETIPQSQLFSFDNFEWQILNVKKFDELGSESYPQKPSNEVFLVIEFQIKNISSKPHYYGQMVLLANGTQYPSSSSSAYGSYQLGYDNNQSTKIEAGVTLKSYVVFDIKDSSASNLLIKQWFGDKRIKVSISS